MAHIAKYQSGAIGNMVKHYSRKMRDPEKRENIDTSRSHLNYNLCPERDLGEVEFIQSRIESLGLKRAPRKDAVRMCDCVVTMPKSLGRERAEDFFSSVYRFLSRRFGEVNVISAWVHMDETTPHMHFAWVPVSDDGKLSAKQVVNRRCLQSLHKDMRADVSADLGEDVEILLDETKKAQKELSRLPQAEYKAAMDEIKRAQTELESEKRRLERLRGRADEAEREVENLKAEVASIDARRAEVDDRIGVIRGKVESVDGYRAEVDGRCSVLGERVEQLKAVFLEKLPQLGDWIKSHILDAFESLGVEVKMPIQQLKPPESRSRHPAIKITKG